MKPKNFLKNASQVPAALHVINDFSKASGLCLNLHKCELLAVINNNKVNSIDNIPVKEEVTYLGILISKDQNLRCSLNFDPIIKKTKNKLNQWLQRDLSLKGRVLITKAEGISRLTYVALSIHLDNQTIKNIDRLLFDFIWKNRTHYIKKSVVMNDYEHGGLNFLDFATLNNTFKINWARHFLKNPVSIWNFIPHHIFSRFGGLKFILSCNYNVDKLPVKLSAFHRQVFLSWSLIYKHNFSPHKYIIWNNRDILFKNKSLFLERWVQNNVILVSQLFNEEELLFSYREFLATYTFPVTPKEFPIVFDAIPSGTLMLFRNLSNLSLPSISLPDPTDSPIGKICFSPRSRNNNRHLRALFQKDVVFVSHVILYWNRFVNDIDWNKVWMIPHKYLITNKVKEVSFRIIHRYYPANHYMAKFKRDINTDCSFCEAHPETVLHLFWHCSHTKKLWKDFSRFIIDYIHKDFALSWENVLFCFYKRPKKEEKLFFLINLLYKENKTL